MRKKIIFLFTCFMMILIGGCNNGNSDKKEINISVAASLVEPIKQILSEYETENNIKINVNSGGSGVLKKQISEGADIGLFFSANEKYVDELIEENLIEEDKKQIPIGNKLVLIKSNDSKYEINTIMELSNSECKIAVGEVNTVPAGQYAKESLINMKLWDSIQDKIIFCKDVTAVKTYVEKAEVDYGFIYKSDSLNLKDSEVIFEIDENLHSPICYTLAPIKGYKYEKECKDIIDYIISDKSLKIFKDDGFNIKE